MFGKFHIQGQKSNICMRGLGIGGGVPDADQLVQWLNYLKEDGITLNDKLEVVTLAEPTLVGVNAVDFAGTGSFKTAATTNYFQQTGIFNIEFWHRRNAQHTGFILGMSEEDGATNQFQLFWVAGSDSMSLRFKNGSDTIFNASKTMPTPDTLHHYRIYGDGYYVYFLQDGALVGSLSSINRAFLGGTTTGTIRVGAANPNNANPVNGSTADLKVTKMEDIELYLFIGQSNALGGYSAEVSDRRPPAEYDILQEDWYYSFYWDNAGGTIFEDRFVPLQSATYGASINDASWTAEIIVGKNISDTFGSKKRAMIKCAKGGTNSWTDWSPAGDMYIQLTDMMTEMMADLTAQGYNPTITTVYLNQGEANATQEANALRWESDWENIRTNLIADTVMTESAKWVTIRTHNHNPAWPFIDDVRAEQMSFGDKYGVWLDSDSFQINVDDDTHYNWQGKLDFGAALTTTIENYTEVDNDVLVMPLEEGTGPNGYDISAGLNHGLLEGTIARTTFDGIPSHNHQYGCMGTVNTDGSGQYFDLEREVTEDTEIHLAYRYLEDFPAGNNEVLGVYVDPTHRYRLYGNPTNGFIFEYGDAIASSGIAVLDDSYQDITLSKAGLLINDTLYTFNITPTWADVAGNLYLFKRNNGGGNAVAEMGPLQWSEPDGQKLDLQPMAGGTLIDKLTGTYYTNQGPDVLVTKYYPALRDGSTTATGGPITLSGCKSSGVHNGSECGVLQTDIGVTGRSLWTTPAYWQDFVDHPNGTDNVYLKFTQDPSCKVKEAGTYDELYDPDYDTQVKLHKYWLVGTCGTTPPPDFITLTIGANVSVCIRDEASDVVSGDGTHFAYEETLDGITIRWSTASGGQWEVNKAGRVSQQSPSTNLLPPEDGWPTLSVTNEPVSLEWGNTTAYNILVDNETHEVLQDTDTGHFLGEAR